MSGISTGGQLETPGTVSGSDVPPEPAPKRSRSFDELGTLLALVVMVAIIGVFNPEFFRIDAIVNVVRQATFFGIIALGMVFLLSMREIDLSVGSLYGLTITASAFLIVDGMDPWLAAAVGILLGGLLGAFNGVITNALRISTIIVTLGTLSMFRGITLLVSDSRPIGGMPTDHAFFELLGSDVGRIPVASIVFVLLTLLLMVVYKRSRFGYAVRAIGSNDVAARLGGIPTARIRLYVMILVGVLCGISGMLTLAFFGSSDPNFGTGFELSAIAAAVIGGTTLSGGRGSVLGALLGALTIGVIRAGLIFFGLQPAWSTFTTGAIIIGAVALDQLVRRRKAAREGDEETD